MNGERQKKSGMEVPCLVEPVNQLGPVEVPTHLKLRHACHRQTFLIRAVPIQGSLTTDCRNSEWSPLPASNKVSGDRTWRMLRVCLQMRHSQDLVSKSTQPCKYFKGRRRSFITRRPSSWNVWKERQVGMSLSSYSGAFHTHCKFA